MSVFRCGETVSLRGYAVLQQWVYYGKLYYQNLMKFFLKILPHGTWCVLVVLAALMMIPYMSRASVSVADSTDELTGSIANPSIGNKGIVADSLQQTMYVQPPLKWHSMISRIPGDWVRWSKSTFQMENIPEILGITALSWLLIVTDEDSWQASKRIYEGSGFVKSTSDFFTMMGDGRTQFGMGGAFGLYGLVTSDERALRTGSEIIEAVLSSGTVVQVLKHITGRQSPFVSSERGGAWVFFPNQIEYHKHVPCYDAFPSGHIATSTATVVVIAENYPDSKWIRPVGFTIVGLIGIGMVNTGIHWYSDYPLGIALGYVFGMIAAHPEGVEIGKIAPDHGIQMSLVPTADGCGIGIGFKFHI